MTTLVQTRRPLQLLDPMSNQNKRRRSGRLASYDEHDGDFEFTRVPKKVKTGQPEPVAEEEPAQTTRPSTKKTRQKAKAETQPPQPTLPVSQKSGTRGNSKRNFSQVIEDEAPVPSVQPKPRRGRPPRKSADKSEKEPSVTVNGTTQDSQVNRTPEPVASRSTPMDVDNTDDNSRVPGPQKIALPFSDTPIINRNKEMRKKTGGSRRSSLGNRGRRASSLIESGHTAIPHREVDASEFYKHIEADGLTEPRRMKQLLMWCGERALAEKPPLGLSNTNAIHGARAIQDQLLKDFASKSEFSDWFAREDVDRPPAVVKPNPRNIEHEEKIVRLEERIKRLKAEKKAWQSLRQSALETSPLLPPASATENGTLETELPTPDVSLLDSEDGRIMSSLTGPSATPFSALKPQIHQRLKAVQATMEFKVDRLADCVHKVERRMDSASSQADRILALSAARLKDREEKEKKRAGTRDMPVMEVLRSLGRILPEGGG